MNTYEGNIEAEANLFAIELLMPEKMIRAETKKLLAKKVSLDIFESKNVVTELARIFDVPVIAMSARLINLGILTP